ncbi:MAG: transglycosylase SLT domain-containing protein [Candidatus Zixiibacteriota bacterium]
MITAPKSVPIYPGSSLEDLRGSSGTDAASEKALLKKATQEFESFFIYYMMKTMRKTIPENSLAENSLFSTDSGKDIYTQMFDMEIARSVTKSSNCSIGDILYKSLEKLVDAKYSQTDESGETEKFVPLPEDEIEDIKLDKSGLKLPDDLDDFKKVIEPPNFIAVSQSPRPVTENRIMTDYGRIIDEAARENSLDSALIASIIEVESGGRADAVSPAGAKGLMQLADSTAGDYGVSNVFDPEENIKAGSRFLKNLLKRYDDLDTALAAYNAGPGNVDKYGGIPPFEETRNYVKKVNDLLTK